MIPVVGRNLQFDLLAPYLCTPTPPPHVFSALCACCWGTGVDACVHVYVGRGSLRFVNPFHAARG